MEMGVALTRVDLERVWEVVFCQWWHLHISFQRSWPLPGKQSTWLSAGHSQEAAVKSQAYPMMSSAYPTPVSKYYITCRLNITSLWANHHWPVGVKHWTHSHIDRCQLRPHRDTTTTFLLTTRRTWCLLYIALLQHATYSFSETARLLCQWFVPEVQFRMFPFLKKKKALKN